jgi:hypothetical protein
MKQSAIHRFFRAPHEAKARQQAERMFMKQ